MLQQYLEKINAFACFTPLCEADFARFSDYRPRDFNEPSGVELAIRMINEIVKTVDIVCHIDAPPCIIDFMVTASPDTLNAILNHYELSMNYEKALHLVLKHYCMIYCQKFHRHGRPIAYQVEDLIKDIMSAHETLQLLEWADLSEEEFLHDHILQKCFPSFSLFCTAALNVYADNTGFNTAFDRQLLEDGKTYLKEIGIEI